MSGGVDEIGLRDGRTFQGKITSVALITTVAVLAAACVAFIGMQWQAERRSVATHNAVLAKIVAEHAAEELLEREPGEANHLVQSLARSEEVRAAYLVGADGRVLAFFSRRGAEADVPPTAADELSQVRAPMILDGRTLGELILVADHGGISVLLARYLAIVGALFFAATGLAMFMSRWMAVRMLRPVRALSGAMHALAESGDYTQRAPVIGDDVFGQLTCSFNELMDKLQANDRALRHTLRELTVARDAAEAANVLKSQFLANMSHEIRTPLNGVLAMAQVMELSALDPGQRERLTFIRHSGEALLAVLNDVLDLSKIEAGKLELESAEFDLGALARSVALAYAPTAAGKDLAFALEVAPSAEGLRLGDPARMRQILGNLTSNAVKFTASGGVRLRFEGVGADGADALVVTIEDTGCGVAADKLPLLFEKFTQVDNSATRRFGGTGLGLAICRELTTLMGGRITVRSVEGRGSVFRVDLPFPRTGYAAEPEAGEAVAAAAREQTDEPPIRILAAEDNPTNQRVLRAVLDTFGVDLTLVENGRLAVEAWASGGFDLILMDIQMPEMDGVTATRAIRAAERASGRPRTPIIALSANAMTHQVSEYLAQGMDAHVAKPIEIVRLQAVLEEQLDRAGAERAAAAA